jgi:ferredoxin
MPGLRIVVDRELCEGNARCAHVAPEVFRVGDDDKLVLLIERPTEEMRDAVETAAAICPRQALKLTED